MSPELALVCPELRALAIAQLADREPDAWLRRSAASTAGDQRSALEQVAADAPGRSGPSLPVALLCYTARSAATFVVEAALLVGLLVGVLSVMAVFHP